MRTTVSCLSVPSSLGRFAPLVCDAAESATTHPVSPSRLWLGDLPGGERTRPHIPGVLTQDTFLRVYIPVAR